MKLVINESYIMKLINIRKCTWTTLQFPKPKTSLEENHTLIFGDGLQIENGRFLKYQSELSF